MKNQVKNQESNAASGYKLGFIAGYSQCSEDIKKKTEDNSNIQINPSIFTVPSDLIANKWM